MFIAANESAEIREIMKGWLTDFYNEANGQG